MGLAERQREVSERIARMYRNLQGTPGAVLGHYLGDLEGCEPYLHIKCKGVEYLVTGRWATGDLEIVNPDTGRPVDIEVAQALLREHQAAHRETV